MALATNLARLRARIRKELQARETIPSPEQPVTAVAGPTERPAASPQAAAERRKTGQRADVRQAAQKGVGAGRSFLRLAQELMAPDTSRSPDESMSDRLRSGVSIPSMPADIQSALAGLSPGVGGSGFAQGQLPADAFSLANFGPFSQSAQTAAMPDPSQLFGDMAATPTSPIQAQQASAATPIGQAFQGAGGRAVGLGASGLGSLLGALGSFTDNKTLSRVGTGIGAAGSAFESLRSVATGGGINPFAGIGTVLALIAALAEDQRAAAAAAEGAKMMGAIAAPMSGPLGMALFAAADTGQYLANRHIPASGAVNNPIKGSLYSDATAGLGQANQLLSRGGTGNQFADIVSLANSIAPYYATAQGGAGPIRASDAITGGRGAAKSEPFAGGLSIADYQGQFGHAKTGLEDLVEKAMAGGATYEQLGRLPVTLDWTKSGLDAGNTPGEFVFSGPRAGALQAEANSLFRGDPMAVSEPASGEGGGWQHALPKSIPDQTNELLAAALGPTASNPDAVNPWVAQMYGGPLWTALARMGSQRFMPQIHERFDPWGQLRGDPAQAFTPGRIVAPYGDPASGEGGGWQAAHMIDNPAYKPEWGTAVPPWMQAQTPAAPVPETGLGGLTATAGTGLLGAPPAGVAPLGSSGFASLKGPRSELLTAEDPNRL